MLYPVSHLKVQTISWIFIFQGFTDHQLMLVEDNTEVIEERERQIRSIVESISQLNEIFRDLATMIVEQVDKWNKSIQIR